MVGTDWRIINPDVPARVSFIRGGEITEGNATRPRSQMILTLPYGTDLQAGDRVLIAGVRYDVDSVGQSDMGVSVRAMLVNV